MTVGELKEVLKGVADETELAIFLPEQCRAGATTDYMRHVKSARFHGQSPISHPELELTAGDFYDY